MMDGISASLEMSSLPSPMMSIGSVDVRLVELPEPAPLGPLAPVDLPNLEAAEGKSQLAVVQGDVFRQRDRQIKAQG